MMGHARQPQLTYALQTFNETGPMRPPYLLCKGIAAAGWKVEILALAKTNPDEPDMAWGIVPVNRVGATIKIFGLLLLFLKLLLPRKNHIVLSFIWDWHCIALMISKRLFGSPYAVVLDTYTHRAEGHGTSRRSILKHEVRYGLILKNANIVLAETPTVKTYTELWAPGPKVLQIPHALWLEDLQKIEVGWAREGFQPQRNNEILYVGRIVQRKNLHQLIEAFAQLSPAYPDWTMSIQGPVGDAAYYQKLKEQIVRFGLKEFVAFKPPIYDESLYRCYRSAAVYCLPSEGEGFPGTILEAMYFGGAIVAASSGYVAYQLNYGECGLIHKPGDLMHLKDHLAALMASSEERDRLMAAARERLKKVFTWESYIEELEQNLLAALDKQ